MGRWISPDWAEKPEDVPYASLDNPQSLNLYGYVLDNPLKQADGDGHESQTVGGGCNPLTGCILATYSPGEETTNAEARYDAYVMGARAQSQNQYGKQPDGSYKADPAKVKAALLEGKRLEVESASRSVGSFQARQIQVRGWQEST